MQTYLPVASQLSPIPLHVSSLTRHTPGMQEQGYQTQKIKLVFGGC